MAKGFQAARQAEDHLIHRRVLRVHMVNRIAEGLDGGQRVGPPSRKGGSGAVGSDTGLTYVRKDVFPSQEG
jgi:hypothetical protein